MRRKRKEIRIYVGCGLTGASKRFIRLVKEVKMELAKRNKGQLVILDFLGLGEEDDAKVFKFDIGQVKKCDLFIAFVDQHSTGLGIEFGAVLFSMKIPFLVLGDYRKKFSKMVTGAPKVFLSRGLFMQYTSAKNAVRIIEQVARCHRLLKRFKYN